MPSLPRSLIPGIVAAVVISACDSTPSGTLTQCTPEHATEVLPLNSPQERVLSTDDCLIDQFRAQGWRLPIESRTRVQIDLESGSFNPLLLVTDSALILVGLDDDSGEGASSRLLRELGEGDYFVWALSIFRGQTGGYELSATEMEGALCSEILGDLDIPDTVTGTLTEASCIRPEDGSFADPWRLEVTPGRELRVTLSSQDFQSLLFITDEEGGVLEPDGDGLTSQIVADLEGTYTVWVNTTGPWQVGDYELTVEEVEEDEG